MARHFLAPTPRFGRVNNRLPIGHQQRSPYYWWWQYLRRNAEYIKCCEQGGAGELEGLYADFGDIREDDFHKWWTGGKGFWLYSEQPLTVSFGELENPAEWQPHWGKEEVMVIAVPLTMSKRRLKGAFAKLLDKRHTGNKSGRPSLAKLKEVSTARYKLEHNYTISGLMTTLAVYDLWVENQTKPKAEKLALWEIGKALNINKKAITRAESKLAYERLDGRNVLGATVSRYVKQAKAMIQNAATGKFPLM